MFKNIILPTVLLLASLFTVFYYVRAAMQKMDLITQEVAIYDKNIKDSRRIVELQEAAHLEFQSIPIQQRNQLETLIPDSVETAQLALDIETIAINNGVILMEVSLPEENEDVQTNDFVFYDESAPPTQPTDYLSKDMVFGVQATYENFKEFLAQIEKSLRIMDVVAIDLEETEKDSDTILRNFDITVRTYYLGE